MCNIQKTFIAIYIGCISQNWYQPVIAADFSEDTRRASTDDSLSLSPNRPIDMNKYILFINENIEKMVIYM